MLRSGESYIRIEKDTSFILSIVILILIMESLNKIWSRYFSYNWQFGLALILLFGVPRFILVLDANMSGGYGTAFIIFFVMWFTPFIFLTRKGRREIGFKRPNNYLRLLYSFALGALGCGAIYGLFYLLYGNTISNSLVYISKASTSVVLDDSHRLIFFLIAAIPSMLFSPIGEEFLYRGVIHGSFVPKFGETKASLFDSLAFALTHLAHFGIIFDAGVWKLLPVPALLWVLSMFAVSRLFFACKQMCDSIFGAVLSHAGYNFAMMYFIFYHIL